MVSGSLFTPKGRRSTKKGVRREGAGHVQANGNRIDISTILTISATGMNIVLFFSCMFVLVVRRRTPRVNTFLVGIAVAMFCFSTCHVFLGFYRLIMGFIVLRDQPGGPAAFFSDVSIPANVAKVGLHTVNVSWFSFSRTGGAAELTSIAVDHW